MQKKYSWPDNHWSWPIRVTHKHGIRNGNIMWVGGQVDLTPDGDVSNKGDVLAQIAPSIEYLRRVLVDLEGDLQDIIHLTCFYAVNDRVSDETFLDAVAKCLPDNVRTTVSVVPLPYLSYEGMVVEIEAVAMRSTDDTPLERQYANHPAISFISDKFCAAVRCQDMIYTSGFSASDINQPSAFSKQWAETLSEVIGPLGATTDNVVKLNRWQDDALPAEYERQIDDTLAPIFREACPASTITPVPGTNLGGRLAQISAIAMVNGNMESSIRTHTTSDRFGRWRANSTFCHGLKCDDMIFISGCVPVNDDGAVFQPGDLSAQTHEAMKQIRETLHSLGAGLDDVCKVLTYYKGDAGADALHDNLPIRSSYYNEPGPATTGIPVPSLGQDGECITIEIYAKIQNSL